MEAALANRISQIKPSATMAINAKAKELTAQGKDIINLSIGEPDFDTPDFVKKAAIDAINQGFTKYTAVDGIAPLKDTIIHKLSRDNQLDYQPHEIIVSAGVKQALYNLTQAILNEGDEAIIPAPYWVSYPAMVQLAGGTPVVIKGSIDQRYKITAEQLRAAITPKTRLLFLNSPSNPSGMAYTEEELKALGNVLKKHPNIIIASDDIYEYILWSTDQFISILNVCPELKSQTIVLNGVSKAHCMTGWRIGFAAGPQTIINGMKKIQSQSTSCANSIAQKAAEAAFAADKISFFLPMLEAYKRRHDFVFKSISQMNGVSCLESDGTFYLFPDMSQAIQRLGLSDDLALATLLLEEANVALVPGTAFGMPGNIRLSCATSDENLEKAVERIGKVLSP